MGYPHLLRRQVVLPLCMLMVALGCGCLFWGFVLFVNKESTMPNNTPPKWTPTDEFYYLAPKILSQALLEERRGLSSYRAFQPREDRVAKKLAKCGLVAFNHTSYEVVLQPKGRILAQTMLGALREVKDSP